MKKIAYVILLLSQLFIAAWAQEGFVVKRIEIEGLQRATPQTVESYLPIKRGQTLSPAKTGDVLRALYQTGFFEHISLARKNNTLVIHVIERPTIGQLKVTGNSVIPTDKLTTVMKSMDIAEGRIYNPAVLEKIKQGLLNQYYQLGRYNARVDVNVSPMSRDRVSVQIVISEGLVAKIHRISIIGNKAFDDKTLAKQLDVSTTGIFSFITQSDRYSEERLEQSMEKLRAFYMDHGYLHFEVKSAQAQVTPDRKSVFINVVVEEGDLYTIKGYELKGKFIVPREDLEKLIKIHPGDTFSRQKIMDSEKAITRALGNKGYIFTKVSLRPQIDDKAHQVTLIFDVNPGKRAYVRHITFSENNRTNDVVLRREMQQMEAAPASTEKLDISKHRLTMLPYIRDVEMSVNPVNGESGEQQTEETATNANDLVDVNYKVKEESSAQATFKIGYSQLYRTMLGAGFNQKNFMGTGNTFGVNLSESKYEQFYGVDYTNPYYTPDGISRSFNFAISKVNPSGAGITSGFTTSEYDLGVLYGIPVGQEERASNRVSVGASYQNTIVYIVPSGLSNQINTFVTRHGTHFEEIDFKLGYARDSRDRAIFPTSGSINTLFADGYAPITRDSLAFYTLNYHGKMFNPITEQFIFVTRADLGYGSGFAGPQDYPFFKNYYAGGIESVRGYQGYTLGPRDSNFRPFGANMLVDASAGLIFPNFISDNLRTTAFLDAGNVYSSLSNRRFGGQSTNSGSVRYAVGLDAQMITPFGPVEISVAQPLNRQAHDDRETIQFALGANF